MAKGVMMAAGLAALLGLAYAQESSEAQRCPPVVVESGAAHYNGKEVILSGQVTVLHSVGKISARHLAFTAPRKGGDRGEAALLKVSDQVQIGFSEGGLLCCQLAEIDRLNMTGLFLGNAHHPQVVYSDVPQDTAAAQGPHSLILHANRIEADFFRGAKALSVKQMRASGAVRVDYHRQYTLLADRLLYDRWPPPSTVDEPTLFALSGETGLPLCQMINLQGDRLYAQKIAVNLVQKWLRLYRPRGTLSISASRCLPAVVAFSSDTLEWDEPRQQLVFKGAIQMSYNQNGRLQTEGEVTLSWAGHHPERRLRRLYAAGRTVMTYAADENEPSRSIICPGSWLIDDERQQMILEAGAEAAQVYIEDQTGELYADRVEIDYRWQGGQWAPEKMVLRGRVRLYNRFDGHQQESSAVLHYALADQVEYWPARQEMVLAALASNRVLFVDKVNQVQMSAPALKIGYDTVAQKEIIQGFGDVRFTFMDHELRRLEHDFTHQDPLEPKG